VAARLIESLAAPFLIGGSYVEQHSSIGVVVWDATRTDNDEFVQEADVALYEAKREGKGHYVVFTPSMHQQAISRFALTRNCATPSRRARSRCTTSRSSIWRRPR